MLQHSLYGDPIFHPVVKVTYLTELSISFGLRGFVGYILASICLLRTVASKHKVLSTHFSCDIYNKALILSIEAHTIISLTIHP